MGAKKLTALTLISVAGLLLTWWGLQTGVSQAAPSRPPVTPVPPGVDDAMIHSPQSPQGLAVQRVQTLTLEPSLEDVMEQNWPVRVEEALYNRPGGGSLRLPYDACDNVLFGLAAGTATKTCSTEYTLIQIPDVPSVQDWITVTYHTRTRAARYRDVVTTTTVVQTNQDPYQPLTLTTFYARHFLRGTTDYETYLSRSQTIPAPDDSSEGEWVRWVTTTKSFTGTVVLHEPLFGSDLTITQFLMSPPAPRFGDRAYFTAVIQNIGVITAWRFYAVELYLKPAYEPPPQNAFDHTGGWDTYGKEALFSGWEQPPLGPGQIHTVVAAITIPLPGTFKAYAQVDTAYNDPTLYAWYGRNPEGYGVPPFTEEKNVVASQPFTIKGSVTYLPIIMKK
jgi:hypothetical protein